MLSFLTLCLREQRHVDTDVCALRELDRVSQQVTQHLPQILFGAMVMVSHPLIHPAFENRVVVQGLGFQQREDFVE
ncbi:hypothetical protein D3C80_1943020 [compost metagenome]